MPEALDAQPRVFRRLALVIAAASLAAAGIATAQYAFLGRPAGPPAGELPPPPLLQDAPRSELETLRLRRRRELESYGRGDDGRVRVPIERAMELLLEDGLPAREPRP